MNAGPAADGSIYERIPAEGTHALRRLMLRNGDPTALVDWPGDRDPGAFHMGACRQGEPICIASVFPEALPGMPATRPYRLRGMATHPEWQGIGVGATLLGHVREALRGEGCDLLWCNARDVAMGFYKRQGFIVYGDGFVIEGIGPHHVMWRVP